MKKSSESPKVYESRSSKAIPKVNTSPKVKAYKPKVPFLTRLVRHKPNK